MSFKDGLRFPEFRCCTNERENSQSLADVIFESAFHAGLLWRATLSTRRSKSHLKQQQQESRVVLTIARST